MTKIYSFHSGKGGVGKTSVVANLGGQLTGTETSSRILLIDSDFFTHGLTFLLAPKTVRFKLTYSDFIKQLSETQDRKSHQALSLTEFHQVSRINTNLYLLPPKQVDEERDRGDRSLWTAVGKREGEQTLGLLTKVSQIRAEVFRKILSEFAYVLIDCRSGSDPASTAPAVLADEYWVVTEEDNTSIRATHFLLNSIHKQYERARKPPKFGGFIINMSITPKQDKIGEYLADAFSGPCLSIISLSYNARNAFIHDGLVVTSHPQDIFSREIKALADRILEKETKPSTDRVVSYLREKRVRALGVAFLLLLALIAAIYLRAPLGMAGSILVAILGAFFGSILIYFYFLYTEGKFQ